MKFKDFALKEQHACTHRWKASSPTASFGKRTLSLAKPKNKIESILMLHYKKQKRHPNGCIFCGGAWLTKVEPLIEVQKKKQGPSPASICF